MFERAVIRWFVLLACLAALLPALAVAQEPDDAVRAGPECAAGVDCDAGPQPGQERIVPSRPSELAGGHEDQSIAILVGLSLVAFAGLVVSVLHRLALDEE